MKLKLTIEEFIIREVVVDLPINNLSQQRGNAFIIANDYLLDDYEWNDSDIVDDSSVIIDISEV
jgi:hypothetical protein